MAQDAVSDMQSTDAKIAPVGSRIMARALAARSGARPTCCCGQSHVVGIADAHIDDTLKFNNDKLQFNEWLSLQGVAIDPVERRLYVTGYRPAERSLRRRVKANSARWAVASWFRKQLRSMAPETFMWRTVRPA